MPSRAVRADRSTTRPPRRSCRRGPARGHKGTFGKLLVIAGSVDYAGAALLVCTAAGRAGAGLVTLATPESLQPLFAAKVVEATTLSLPEDDVEEVDPEEALARILDHDHDALVVGPGLQAEPLDDGADPRPSRRRRGRRARAGGPGRGGAAIAGHGGRLGLRGRRPLRPDAARRRVPAAAGRGRPRSREDGRSRLRRRPAGRRGPRRRQRVGPGGGAQGRANGDRRARTAGPRSLRSRTRRWPAAARATCLPARSARCWPRASARSRRRSWASTCTAWPARRSVPASATRGCWRRTCARSCRSPASGSRRSRRPHGSGTAPAAGPRRPRARPLNARERRRPQTTPDRGRRQDRRHAAAARSRPRPGGRSRRCRAAPGSRSTWTRSSRTPACSQSSLPAGRPSGAVVKADAYGHGAVPVARALVAAGVAQPRASPPSTRRWSCARPASRSRSWSSSRSRPSWRPTRCATASRSRPATGRSCGPDAWRCRSTGRADAARQPPPRGDRSCRSTSRSRPVSAAAASTRGRPGRGRRHRGLRRGLDSPASGRTSRRPATRIGPPIRRPASASRRACWRKPAYPARPPSGSQRRPAGRERARLRRRPRRARHVRHRARRAGGGRAPRRDRGRPAAGPCRCAPARFG